MTKEREIKFRAWDREEKKLYPGMPLMLLAGWITGKYSLGHDLGRFEFSEYTGLKDKNGKEIYEGDLVQQAIHKYAPVEVEWDETGGYTFFCDSEWGDPSNEYEVIGNIYENPELLEAVK